MTVDDLADGPREIRADDLRRLYGVAAEARGRKVGHPPVPPPAWLAKAADEQWLQPDGPDLLGLSLHQLRHDHEMLVEAVTKLVRLAPTEFDSEHIDFARVTAAALERMEGGTSLRIPTGVVDGTQDAAAWAWGLRTARARELLAQADPSRPMQSLLHVLEDGNTPYRMRGATKVALDLMELQPTATGDTKMLADQLLGRLRDVLPTMDRGAFPEFGTYGRMLEDARLLAALETAARDAPAPRPGVSADTVW